MEEQFDVVDQAFARLSHRKLNNVFLFLQKVLEQVLLCEESNNYEIPRISKEALERIGLVLVSVFLSEKLRKNITADNPAVEPSSNLLPSVTTNVLIWLNETLCNYHFWDKGKVGRSYYFETEVVESTVYYYTFPAQRKFFTKLVSQPQTFISHHIQWQVSDTWIPIGNMDTRSFWSALNSDFRTDKP